MALNPTAEAKFEAQAEFIAELGLVDGMRGVSEDMLIYTVNYDVLPDIDARTVDTFDDLPDPVTIPVDQIWMVLEITPGHVNGGYHALEGAWLLFDNVSLFDEYVSDDFKLKFDLEDQYEVLENWLRDLGFETAFDNKWEYDSGVRNHSVIDDTRGIYDPDTGTATGAMNQIQLYFMGVEGVSTVDELLAITESTDEGPIHPYSEIDQQYMIRDKGGKLAWWYARVTEEEGPDYFIRVKDLRYKFLANGDPANTNSELYNLLMFPGAEKALKNMESTLQSTIIEDDANRQVMSDVWDELSPFKTDTDQMYIAAQITEQDLYLADQIVDVSPNAPAQSDGAAVYSDDGAGTIVMWINTSYAIDSSLGGVVTLLINDVDKTSMITDVLEYAIRVEDATMTPVPASVEVTYHPRHTMLQVLASDPEEDGWPAATVPPTYVRDADDPRLGYRVLKTADIYTPDEMETFDTDYIHGYPYVYNVNTWRVETVGFNPLPFGPNGIKVYFDPKDATNAITGGIGWSCSPPSGYATVAAFLQALADVMDSGVDVIFESSRDLREAPTPPLTDEPDLRYGRRPGGLRAETISLCGTFDTVFDKRAQTLRKKEYYDRVVEWKGL